MPRDLEGPKSSLVRGNGSGLGFKAFQIPPDGSRYGWTDETTVRSGRGGYQIAMARSVVDRVAQYGDGSTQFRPNAFAR